MCGVMILSWGDEGDCQDGWCGETYIMPGQLAKDTDWFDPIHPVKEWPKGIEEFENADGNRCLNKGENTEESYQSWCDWHFVGRAESNSCAPSKITRVRNSSGEVFSVGDEVSWPNCIGVGQIRYGEGKIERFTICDKIIDAHIKGHGQTNIDYLKHSAVDKPITATQLSAAIENFKKELGVK